MVAVPCLITVAAGVFAPGHLGELTRCLPFELVDDVLESTRTVQRRMRAVPSRVGIYFVLAMALFPGIGYLRVWDKMTAALEGLDLPRPSEKALRDLRRRLGPAPVKALFEAIAVPLAPPETPGVAYRGMRTVAFDGLNSVKVPDSDRNRSWLGKTMTHLGLAGYPAMRIVALAETGTRGLLGAVIGGRGERSEVPLARKLVPLLREGMLLLADRAYDAAGLLKEVSATGAHVLVRGSAARKPAVDEVLPDGSCLSRIDGLRVRIIEARLDVHGAGGTRLGDGYRLITTLLDWRRCPAGELVRLYHERWEIEVAYLALRHTLLGGYVLRSRDRAGAEQELWALLTVYQALRMAMVTATGAVPGTDPDRASFTAALESAREQVITARGIEDPGDPDDTGRIGRAVLAALLPARRARYSARKVKCSTSRYHVRDQGRPELPTRITRVLVTIIAPPPDRPAARPRGRRDQPPGPRQSRPDTRRDNVTRIMASQPGRDWAGRDLAALLGIKPRNMLTQLAEWTRLGFLAKTGQGRYAIPEPSGPVTASASP
ncbi:MAG TPA: IS4 family transposase [Streptosporangiaceae bacterium]|nr:IS4 family transposase [Streptosporangiaceae bacterium]